MDSNWEVHIHTCGCTVQGLQAFRLRVFKDVLSGYTVLLVWDAVQGCLALKKQPSAQYASYC